MRTVKEISDITGISVRTLHYYDEIGLLRPTRVNEAGYRFYDDEALETLQQILFFREFDMPLKEIKGIIENPVWDKRQILEGQRFGLEQKKKRLERLLASIDSILKGEKQMDFEVFSKDDVEELFRTFVKNAPEDMLQLSIKEFGSMEAFHKNYVEKAYALYNKPESHQILMESYGDKETVLESAKHPMGQEGLEAFQKEVDVITKELAVCKREGLETDALEVKLLICKYALATRNAYGLKSERHLVTGIADTYRDYERMQAALDQQYGEPGLALYMASAIEKFYGCEN